MRASKQKQWFITVLTLLVSQTLLAKSGNMTWPIPGARAGEDIIGRPQQYIDGKLNYAMLFISAPEGTNVICPADGVISHFSVNFWESLDYVTSYSSSKDTFDEMIREVIDDKEAVNVDSKYLSGAITISLADGRKLHVSGLTGDIPFKTGQRVSKGEIIGKVGYSYKAFKEPHIQLSLSARNSTSDDVMTPFGIESTFVAWAGPKEFLTEEEAKEDISVLIEAFRECYPSLYDVVTDEKLETFILKSGEKCKGGISYDDFFLIIRSATSAELVHDSHIAVLTENPFMNKRRWYSNLHLLSSEGKLFVGHVRKGYEDFLLKTVASVDGEPADSIVSRMRRMCNLFDEKNESVSKETLLKASNWVYNFDYSKQKTSRIVFTDGTEVNDTWSAKIGQYIPSSTADKPYWSRYVRSIKEPVYFSHLNDSTVYFALGTFELNQVQIEAIEDSIKSFSFVPNMVIDMRNNPGGNIEVLEKMVSYFLEKPSMPLKSYKKVNSNSTYSSFAHSSNHSAKEIMFPEYTSIEGRGGFFDYAASVNSIKPDSLVHYSGHLYILTDGTSVSAASEFPAYLVRNNRAVTVGRETGSGYHYMTADKFVDIMLPNSNIQVTIPLIQEVFDDEVTERTPAGRGLLPDYEVPITYEEIYTADNDSILDKALELIAEGNYQPTYVFQEEGTPSKPGNVLYIALAALMILVPSCVLVAKRHKLNLKF